MKLSYDTFDTPVGKFSVALTTDGAIAATAFGGRTQLQSRLHRDDTLGQAQPAPAVRTQVAAYFSGKRQTFDLPLRPTGSPFQQSVWTALQTIPAGETRSYGDIARQLRSAPRAVGRANATNPICLFIPCHRVIGADGSLTGFAFGETIKHRLLEHEGALSPALA